MYKLLIEWLRFKLNLPFEPVECNTCEVLKLELAQLHSQNRELLDKLINPSRIIEEVKDTTNLKPILPHRSNWQTERTRLERLDTIRNNKLIEEKALRAAGQPNARQEEQKREASQTITAPSNDILGSKKSIEELENELSVELPKAVGDN